MTMEKEKVLLLVVDYKRPGGWLLEDIADELQELVEGCGGAVIDRLYYRMDKPSAAFLIGEGKVRELSDLCAELRPDTVIFSYDLKGSQQRNIEKELNVKTIDRTQLILDIFARHATTQEGKMQVELAQLEYLLPRLVGQGIELSRLGGGIGTLGPGETKLEVDRRRISQRIAKLKRQLDEVSATRSVKRKRRQDKGLPTIALVGYTNAGKSTLLNALTGAEQVTRDGLFTTLDSLNRQVVLPNHQKVVVTDTVGFMHDLPHHLIESFKGTLEHIHEADVLLHVLDVSNSNFQNLYGAVNDVLKELNAGDKPVITVLNKIDKLPPGADFDNLRQILDEPVAVSALGGENLDRLIERIIGQLAGMMVHIEASLPLDRMDLVNLAHEEGQVFSVKYYNDRVFLQAALPARLSGQIDKVRLDKPPEPDEDF